MLDKADEAGDQRELEDGEDDENRRAVAPLERMKRSAAGVDDCGDTAGDGEPRRHPGEHAREEGRIVLGGGDPVSRELIHAARLY